jgi:hypothetical protein
VDRLKADDEAQRERELTSPTQTYMRNAHLLPPREEYATVDWYVTVLTLFQRAPANLKIYRFSPTRAQRRISLDELLEWEAAQRSSRGNPSADDRRKRALGLLHSWCFVRRSRGRAPLADIPPDTERDEATKDALRYRAPLVNDGSLSRDDLACNIIDASESNGHIPGNKSLAQVEADIDRAISKYTEAFD